MDAYYLDQKKQYDESNILETEYKILINWWYESNSRSKEQSQTASNKFLKSILLKMEVNPKREKIATKDHGK